LQVSLQLFTICLTENASLEERSCLSYWIQPSNTVHCYYSCMRLLVGTDKIQWVMSCGSPPPVSASNLVTIIRDQYVERSFTPFIG